MTTTTHETIRALAAQHATYAETYDAAAHDAASSDDRQQCPRTAQWHHGASEAYADAARRMEEETE